MHQETETEPKTETQKIVNFSPFNEKNSKSKICLLPRLPSGHFTPGWLFCKTFYGRNERESER
jgi:hypothetical protein